DAVKLSGGPPARRGCADRRAGRRPTIAGERSTATTVPVTRRSATRSTATPAPQPTSTTSSSPRSARRSTARTSRGRAASPPLPRVQGQLVERLRQRAEIVEDPGEPLLPQVVDEPLGERGVGRVDAGHGGVAGVGGAQQLRPPVGGVGQVLGQAPVDEEV